MKIYFLINAALYLALAVLCTVRHTSTASGSGYVQLNNSGHSEYLVIYGGLQLGLAAIFGFLAFNPDYYRAGLAASLMLYVPIAVYRGVTLLLYKPVGVVTVATAVLEGVLLAAAVVLWVRNYSPRTGL
jgi:hypothetical protein